jgi:hypothetical protein
MQILVEDIPIQKSAATRLEIAFSISCRYSGVDNPKPPAYSTEGLRPNCCIRNLRTGFILAEIDG